MNRNSYTRTSEEEMLNLLVRELTDRFPETMPVLATQGIDLCCGGGHRVLKALILHNADLDTVVPELMQVVESVEDRS